VSDADDDVRPTAGSSPCSDPEAPRRLITDEPIPGSETMIDAFDSNGNGFYDTFGIDDAMQVAPTTDAGDVVLNHVVNMQLLNLYPELPL
jgi:hypothetical protein